MSRLGDGLARYSDSIIP